MRREPADSSKQWLGNMCTDLGRWLPHNWGSQWFWGFDGWSHCEWEGGQVCNSSSSSSSFCPRYDSEGKYLGSLPDLATPRTNHGCTSFVSKQGEQVKIIFLLYLKNRAFLLLEVQVASSSICPALSCSSRQTEDGQQEETFQGENYFQISALCVLQCRVNFPQGYGWS